jgi:hypothetical protein
LPTEKRAILQYKGIKTSEKELEQFFSRYNVRNVIVTIPYFSAEELLILDVPANQESNVKILVEANYRGSKLSDRIVVLR